MSKGHGALNRRCGKVSKGVVYEATVPPVHDGDKSCYICSMGVWRWGYCSEVPVHTCVCVRVRACVCVRACVRVFVRVCVYHQSQHANILCTTN